MEFHGLSNYYRDILELINLNDFLYLQEMMDIIREETKRPEHKRLGMFAVVLMAHGYSGDVVFGSDEKPVYLADVRRILSAANFSAMAGKPKLMVILACSGGTR